MDRKKLELESEVFKLVGDGHAGSGTITINALDAACKILDYKFGFGFHKKHPELTLKMTESILKNCRTNDFNSTMKNAIGENIDALRIVILNKETSLSGAISVDIPDSITVD